MTLNKYLSKVLIKSNKSIKIVDKSDNQQIICTVLDIFNDLKTQSSRGTAAKNNISIFYLNKIQNQILDLVKIEPKIKVYNDIPVYELSCKDYGEIKAFGHKMSDIFTPID